jgi:hypothetical protein
MFVEAMILNSQHAVNQIGRDLLDVDEQAALSVRSVKTRNFDRLQLEQSQFSPPAHDLHERVLLKGELNSLCRETMTWKSKFPQIGNNAVPPWLVFPGLQGLFDGFLVPAPLQKTLHLGYRKVLAGIDRNSHGKNPRRNAPSSRFKPTGHLEIQMEKETRHKQRQSYQDCRDRQTPRML